MYKHVKFLNFCCFSNDFYIKVLNVIKAGFHRFWLLLWQEIVTILRSKIVFT